MTTNRRWHSPGERGRLLEELIGFANTASTLILDVYRQDFSVEYKGKDDPVTRADKDANTFLCEAIARTFPGIPIVAEESDPSTFTSYRTAPESFFVDPLDGTREFVAKNGEFCIMLGFAEGGHATAGVILFPALNFTVAGAEGVRAFEELPSGVRCPISTSSVNTLRDATLLVSRSHRPEAFADGEAPFGMKAMMACGSSGLKAARVAQGKAEVYAQPGRAGKLWDVCAPEAVLRAAGGRLTDALGTRFDYRREDLGCTGGVLATNGPLHDSIVDAIARMQEERRNAKNAGQPNQ